MGSDTHLHGMKKHGEVREAQRAAHHCTMRILALNGVMTRIHQVSAYDLSTSELGIVGRHQFAPHDELVFALHRETRTVLLRCMVVHSRPLPDGTYRTVTRFMDTVSQVRGKEQIPAAWLGFQAEG